MSSAVFTIWRRFEQRPSQTEAQKNIPAGRELLKILSSCRSLCVFVFSLHLVFVLLEVQTSPGGRLSLGLHVLQETLLQLVRVGLQLWNYRCRLGGWGYMSRQFVLV